MRITFIEKLAEEGFIVGLWGTDLSLLPRLPWVMPAHKPPDKTIRNGVTRNEKEESVLVSEYQNAQDRLAEQQETFREFSNEGMNIFRLLLLFVAAPAAILGALGSGVLGQFGQSITSSTCAVQTGVDCISMLHLTGTTTLGLFLTAVLHIAPAGYEARGVHNLTNPSDLHEVLNSDESSTEYYRRRLREYRDRIEHNDRIIHYQEGFLGIGKGVLVSTIGGLAVLSYPILIGPPLPAVIFWAVMIIALFGGLATLYSFPRPYTKADRPGFLSFNPLYSLDYRNDREGPDSPNVSSEKGGSDSDSDLPEHENRSTEDEHREQNKVE